MSLVLIVLFYHEPNVNSLVPYMCQLSVNDLVIICAVSCLMHTEEDERAYFLKSQAERKQRFKFSKKKLNQRGRDRVSQYACMF